MVGMFHLEHSVLAQRGTEMNTGHTPDPVKTPLCLLPAEILFMSQDPIRCGKPSGGSVVSVEFPLTLALTSCESFFS